ncbi:hypothetical protein PMAYCL1PPCAC_07605 [Pristionchus mayeri]|uniref:Uncharacterized protein n=1 Tax=Pristionchus mayeri TaxID=1317129 RepID=A0AAN4ZI72_9BILA|nr:hypothetical protein PMAYCL1PPCAC_07605 [Pristionchus mayeri]
MPEEVLSCRNTLLLFLNFLCQYCVIVNCNPLGGNVEGSAEEPITTTTKSPEEIQAEYEEFCKHRGPFCFEQTYVNIAITILGALVFLISACIAGCVSRRQGNV